MSSWPSVLKYHMLWGDSFGPLPFGWSPQFLLAVAASVAAGASSLLISGDQLKSPKRRSASVPHIKWLS